MSSEPENDERLEEDATEGAVRATGLTAGVAVLFLLLRLLAVSGWNWDTASEVLETINIDDSISILFGTLFAVPVVAGILVALLLPLAVADLIRLHSKSQANLGQALLALVLAVTAAALFKTFKYWWLPVEILAVCAGILIHKHLQRRSKDPDIVLILVKRVGAAALLALLVMAATVRTPWTPEEKITTQSGVVVGYVLDTESGYLKVLQSSDREIVIVVSSQVEARTPIR